VAETDAVGRIAFNEQTGAVTGKYQKILSSLPSGDGHWTRTLRIGPDGWLYVTVGSSCNVCIEEVPERAAMLRLRLDGSDKQLYATGLRNSVDFDWSPIDGEIYATDNGRDWQGDDFPPDELNRIVEDGFYGWPYANGNKIPDPDFGAGQPMRIAGSLAPVFEFRAHNAPLGMTFLRHQSDSYQHAALVALHGSWNRSSKDGYKVVSLHWNESNEVEARDFITGFLDGESVNGRPVGLTEATDGTIYISDDYAGVIYRVTSSR
ncbi:MAG: PQQ-dependent sugar dehydrogenase, partial [Pseudomonadales bacterium]